MEAEVVGAATAQPVAMDADSSKAPTWAALLTTNPRRWCPPSWADGAHHPGVAARLGERPQTAAGSGHASPQQPRSGGVGSSQRGGPRPNNCSISAWRGTAP